MTNLFLRLITRLLLSVLSHRAKKPRRGMRLVPREYQSPAQIEPEADHSRWTMYLASFGLQCALADLTSERSVCAAGIVANVQDYRTYARLLRRYGVWHVPGARAKTRWIDRRPLVGVGRLRDAIVRGRVLPRWPSPTPPPVRAVSGGEHAHHFAD
jgi:hypothetical protein